MFTTAKRRLVRRWRTFWLGRGGYRFWGRIASRLGALGAGQYRHQCALTWMTRRGFISPRAEIIDVDLRLRGRAFIADGAVVARWRGNGFVELADGVQINRGCMLELIEGGSITIDEGVAIQNGCVLFSGVEPIIIHRHAQIACYCAFYSYDHGIDAGSEIYRQPLTSKGPIVVGEDAWLGVCVKVMSGVTIGRGAVIGAGSVVTRDIPANAIAAGVPARVLKYRPHAEVAPELRESHTIPEPVSAE